MRLGEAEKISLPAPTVRYGRAVSFDHETFHLFDASNVDAYDSGAGRYPMVLKAGLAEHGLELDDVLAVTQDLSLWVICRTGIFEGSLRGMFNKRAQIEPFIAYATIDAIRAERSGPHTSKIVVTAGGRKVAQIDFRAGGPDRTLEEAAAHHHRILQTMQQAWRAAHHQAV